MKRFAPYFWFLLPKPCKRAAPGDQTEIRRVVEVLGSLFDDAKLAIFRVRRAWTTKTAPAEALDLIGADRDLRRMPGEEEDAYRRRLLSAFDLYQQGGTVPGMVLAMELLGYPGAEVSEPRSPRRYDGSMRYAGTLRYGEVEWALFTVTLDPGVSLTSERLDLVLRTIHRWKPAHTMLAYLVLAPAPWQDDCLPTDAGLDLVMDHSMDLADLYVWPVAIYDGTYQHDGAVLHDGEIDPLSVRVF